MDEAIGCRLLTIRILLGREPHQALLEEVDLQRVETRDERIDPQVILKALDQVRIAHVLRYDVARLPLHLLLQAYNFDAAPAGRSCRLHDIHMTVVFGLTVHAELAVVVGEQVRFGAKVELCEDFTHP